MVDANSLAPPTDGGSSTLVFGTGENPMSILAAALARRAHSPFGWAHCSASTDGMESTALHLLRENSDPEGPSEVDPRELRAPPPAYEAHLSQLVVPETISAADRSRLTDYLHLPILLQRFLSSARIQEGESVLVLTNADALPPYVADEGLGRSSVHEALHREHASLVVTYRGTPPGNLSNSFDQVYRIEAPVGSRWEQAMVTVERGTEHSGLPSPTSLRDLLPWLGLTDLPLGVPGRSHGHYLP
ncbi:MAG: hypothetical protein ACLPZM_03140 [Thermoplasmata archaeon]